MSGSAPAVNKMTINANKACWI